MPHIRRASRVLAAMFLVCAFATPGLAQDSNPSLRLPTIAATAAAAADWATTYHALKNYQVREVNPLLRPWEETPGKLVTAGALMDAMAFSTWNLTMGKRHPRIAAAGMWAMAGFRTYLAIHNMRNTQRAARR